MTRQILNNPIKEALKCGQSIWYDGFLPKEEFAKLIEDGIRGATTNPTIFEKAISSGAHDAEIRGWAKTHGHQAIYKLFVVKAVQEAADVFWPVYRESKGQDGFVSLEVSPLLAYDTEGTVREARDLYRLVGRKNLMIKVPATLEGIPAVRTLISEGINVNITLIFSVERYRRVMEAYLLGLEERARQGKTLEGIASVASFFVSRVDTAVDKLLEEKCLGALLGKTAIANSKIAYREFEKMFSEERFKKLEKKGAALQRPLWASTGTKNPNFSDVLYVETLIGAHTVNTMPPATLEAFRDHGAAASRIQEEMAQADEVLREVKQAGISLERVTQDLEKAGVELFAQSYRKIIEAIEVKLK